MLTLKTIGDVSDEEMVIDIDKDSEGDVYLKQDKRSGNGYYYRRNI